ncbi:MAG: RNA polymerase sigma factor [Candidatus Levyibacteriota bacterium]
MEEKLKDLIQKAQSGDRNAFGEIYQLYYKKIYRYCSFNVYDAAAAQDICQETFVKAWIKVKDFKMEKADWSFQAFLFAIARNLIIDRSRAKKEYALEAYEELESDEDHYEALDKKADIERVRTAISKLEEVERQIVILRFFEEMDSKEVANILKIKDGALRVRQSRVLSKLKNIMEVLSSKQTN